MEKIASIIPTEEKLETFIKAALQEDVGAGDHTSLACILPRSRSKARLFVKDPGVLAGVVFAEKVFRLLDPSSVFQVFIEDGSSISCGDVAFTIECNSRALLQAERLVLNCMQRMSGIATMSNRFKFEVEDLPVKILDTRKTTPLLRFLEKWAVKLGGCHNYRFGLYDWIMIKDNHIDACGGIPQAIERVKNYKDENNFDLDITIEVRNLVELYQVLEAGNVTRIMLDNFEITLLQEAVSIIGDKFETEASGGININNVRAYAQTGVNYISVGALTHSYNSLDLSLKVEK